MNRVIEVTTHSPDETQRLGHCLGRIATAGTVLRLCGDLGSGKTCFVQGLARGLEVPPAYDITSPTYTLIHAYPGRVAFYHVDLYRLADPADADAVGLWDILGEPAVVAVEWAERLPDTQWPAESVRIEFEVQGDWTRSIRLIGSGLETGNLIRKAVDSWNG
jgi:tRNA threonylcarbamoyladenosine biosynthesis protein TsaE